ncbi:MAG: enoyl-ACP reductase [Phycisphaeraceae bacterium]
MGLLDGKRGIVFGIANDHSYAWHITKELRAAGATCAFTHLRDASGKMERRCRLALEELAIANPWLMPCDAAQDDDLDAVFEQLAAEWGEIDFVIHSIAYADRQFLQPGTFYTTSRAAWNQALDISAYSLVAMAQRASAIMPGGGSILAMTYYGGEKVVPGYNVMGVAKAALEHTARYLAADLGVRAIRVNTISGGPLRTLAASAVGVSHDMFEQVQQRAPLRRNIAGEDVGRTAVYLVSDLASGVTGEVLHVDAGLSIIAR